MKTATKHFTDTQIIEKLLGALHLTANSLSVELNYSSPSSIYHIINGINNISEGFAQRVVAKFTNVNYLFLKKGELPVLLDDDVVKAQENTLYSGPTFNDIPLLLKNIEKLLHNINQKLDSND